MSLISSFLQKTSSKAGKFRFFVNLYPPFMFSGIRVKKVSKDFRFIKVKLNLSWYNRNYVGTQFGGNLFSMTDPFYMIMLLKNLGNNYIVWDKSACIKYVKPGKTEVFAEFVLNKEKIDEILKEVESKGKYEPVFKVEIKDKNGEVIAVVDKVLYVRKR